MPNQGGLRGSLKARGKGFALWGGAVLLFASPPQSLLQVG